ncbi:MAG: cytochrome c, partial [Phycisphaeraceae bacterium]
MAEAIRNRSKLPPIPAWLVYVIIISVVGSWVPLSLIALARVEKSNRQRIQLFQDMGVQPRIEAQQPSPLFADGRGMRLPVESTVARGELREDDHFYRGYETDNSFEPVMDGEQLAYYDDLPDQIQVSRELLQRGQERFNIACATCHGAAGYGDGLTHRRVQA